MKQQRVSLITLGVKDMAKAASFYEDLGWARVESQDGVVAFDLIGQTMGLYPLGALAEDLGLFVETLGEGRMTLGYNAVEKADVAPFLAKAKADDGDILKPVQDVFWAGHHGYFADPEGHIRDIVHNSFIPLGPNGDF